jgi:outer membrane protein
VTGRHRAAWRRRFLHGALWLAGLLVAARPAGADPPPAIPAGGQLTLQQAIELTLAYHPRRKATDAERQAATERIGEARSALLPQVYVVADDLRATDNGIGDTAYLPALGVSRAPSTGRYQNQLTDTFDNYVAGVSAFQYLFDFGRTRGLISERSAEADAEHARLQLLDLDLVYQTSARYYDLLAAREIVKVYEQAVNQRQEHLQEVQVKAKAGLKPEIDVYTAQAELARAQTHLVDARAASEIAKVALDNAMGLGEKAPAYEPADTFAAEEIPDPIDAYMKRAFDQRPDLQMFEDQARAAGARIQEFRSDYLPTVGAAAGYNLRGQDRTPGNNYYAGLVISWPLFNGFRTDHEVAEARLQQQAAEHTIDDLRQRIALQVRRSYLTWKSSLERIRKARQTLAASEVELTLATRRYQIGLGNIIELTDAQRRFTQDGAAYVKARADASIAKAALDRDSATEAPTG